MQELMKKITLLLVCMPSSMMGALLASSLVYMFEAYPAHSEAVVTMMVTMPNLTIMIGLVLAPVLIRKFSIKAVMLAGIVIFTLASIIPAWCETFYVMLLFRGISGVGCGMILPLQSTFLATYPAKQRASLMGLSASVGCLIAAVMVSVSGFVAAISWRYVFYLYLINVIPLILAVLFLPNCIDAEEPASQVETIQAEAPKLMDYSRVLALYYIFMLGMLFLSILSATLAPYLEYAQLGGSEESGLLLSVSILGSVAAGLIMRQYISYMKQLALPVIFAGSALGFVMLWLSSSLLVIGAAVFIIGAFTSLLACLVNYELSCRLPLSIFTSASAGTNFLTFVLQFAAPLLFQVLLGSAAGGSFYVLYMSYAVIMAGFTIMAVILPKMLLKENK